MAPRSIVIKALVIPALAAVVGSPPAQTGRLPCLRYGPETVEVSGVLARHMFYGAPGYGEDPEHDQKEVGFYLDLAAPMCMVPEKDGDTAKTGIRRIQLVLDADGYAQLRPRLGQKVTLRGTLFGAVTGHHHAPVLLDVARPVRVMNK